MARTVQGVTKAVCSKHMISTMVRRVNTSRDHGHCSSQYSYNGRPGQQGQTATELQALPISHEYCTFKKDAGS